MTPDEAFIHLYGIVTQKENFVPRNHPTIGGMWSVDTWQRGNVKAQLQDEGSTRMLMTIDGGLRVTQDYHNNLCYYAGDEAQLVALAKAFGL